MKYLIYGLVVLAAALCGMHRIFKFFCKNKFALRITALKI